MFHSPRTWGLRDGARAEKLSAMTRVPILSSSLIRHRQTGCPLTSWPQDGCNHSRHHAKAVPARVETETVNVLCASSLWKESPPPADSASTALEPGDVCSEMNTMLLDGDSPGRGEAINRDS